MKDMYKYIGEYPKNRNNGWQENIQGVCHDDKNWFFTQTSKLWKFPVSHSLDEKIEKANPYKGIFMLDYKEETGEEKVHLGDIDQHKGFIFAPVEGHGKPYIAVFSAKDLSLITKQTIMRNECYYNHLAWCAINPNNGYLYTSDGTITNAYGEEVSPVVVYAVDYDAIKEKKKNFLTQQAILVPLDENRKYLKIKETQGGCFDNENHLHISNGYGWWKNRDNNEYGVAVFDTFSYLSKGCCYGMKMISRSSDKGPFKYEFHSIDGEEVEGLTYWDLNGVVKAPKIKGALHVIMLDNDISGGDDLYFKHYDRIN